MDIGVRELKANLSKYLDRAAKGETIRVTERGKPKALLVPVPGQVDLSRGIAEGWIRPGDGSIPDTTLRRHAARMTVQEAFDEDRGD